VRWHLRLGYAGPTGPCLLPLLDLAPLDHIVHTFSLLLLQKVGLLHLEAPLLLFELLSHLAYVVELPAALIIGLLAWLHEHHHCGRRVRHAEDISYAGVTSRGGPCSGRGILCSSGIL